MVVAIKSMLWPQVGSLLDLVALSEFGYFAIFVWLAVAGFGSASPDHVLTRQQKADVGDTSVA